MTKKIEPLPTTQDILKNLDRMIQDVASGGGDERSLFVAITVYGAVNAIIAELVALRAEIAAQDRTVVINKGEEA